MTFEIQWLYDSDAQKNVLNSTISLVSKLRMLCSLLSNFSNIRKYLYKVVKFSAQVFTVLILEWER